MMIMRKKEDEIGISIGKVIIIHYKFKWSQYHCNIDTIKLTLIE